MFTTFQKRKNPHFIYATGSWVAMMAKIIKWDGEHTRAERREHLRKIIRENLSMPRALGSH